MNKSQLLSLCIVALAPTLSACQPTIASRGNILDPLDIGKVKPGVSTREDVAIKLGSPTRVGTFDDKVWYYIGRQTEQYSFFKPDVTKQQVVQVGFDDRGIVTEVKNLDMSDVSDVSAVDRTTPTYGRNDNIIRELLGDLSHPMPNLKNNHGGD